jgi:hypothetical protein
VSVDPRFYNLGRHIGARLGPSFVIFSERFNIEGSPVSRLRESDLRRHNRSNQLFRWLMDLVLTSVDFERSSVITYGSDLVEIRGQERRN